MAVVLPIIWAVVWIGGRFAVRPLSQVAARNLPKVIAHVKSRVKPTLRATNKNPRGIFRADGQLSRANHITPVGRGQFWSAKFREAAANPKAATILSNFRAGMSRKKAIVGLTAILGSAELANLFLDDMGTGPDTGSSINPRLPRYESGENKPWYPLFKQLEKEGENVDYNTWDKLMAEYYREHPEGRGWTPREGTLRVGAFPPDDPAPVTTRVKTRTGWMDRVSPDPRTEVFPNLFRAPGTAFYRDATDEQPRRILREQPRGSDVDRDAAAREDSPIEEAQYTRGTALRLTNQMAAQGGPWKEFWQEQQKLGFRPDSEDPNLAESAKKVWSWITKDRPKEDRKPTTRRRGSPRKKGGVVNKRVTKQYAKGGSVRTPKRVK
jgi:hypothetical protein